MRKNILNRKLVFVLLGGMALGIGVIAFVVRPLFFGPWLPTSPAFATPPPIQGQASPPAPPKKKKKMKTMAPPLSAELQALSSQLRKHVGGLTSTSVPRSIQTPKGLHEAALWLEGIWKAQGFAVQKQSFPADGQTYENLWITYGPPQAERIVIGAHYDVCGQQPGADDNASGVAGLLEISAWLAKEKPKLTRRLDLIAWTLEEPPYFATEQMGSAVHARWLKAQKIPVAAAISLEMIGFYTDRPLSQTYPHKSLSWIYPSVGNFLALVSDRSSAGFRLVREAKHAFAQSTDLPIHSINAPHALRGIDFSDHRSYWAEGYPALMITDTAFFRNPHYHKATDTPATLDYDRMAKAVKGIQGILLALAR